MLHVDFRNGVDGDNSAGMGLGYMPVKYTFKIKLILANKAQFLYIDPTNTQRNKHVINTSKLRFDIIITCLLRVYYVVSLLEIFQALG